MYPSYVNYYSFSSNKVGFRNVINGTILDKSSYGFIVHGLHPFVAAYSSGLYVYPDMQPIWFTRSSQVKSAIYAKLFLSGDIIVNNTPYYISINTYSGRYTIYHFVYPYINKLYVSPPIISTFSTKKSVDLSSMKLKENYIGDRYINLTFTSSNLKVVEHFRFPINNTFIVSFEIKPIINNVEIDSILIPSFSYDGSLLYKQLSVNDQLIISSYKFKHGDLWNTILDNLVIKYDFENTSKIIPLSSSYNTYGYILESLKKDVKIKLFYYFPDRSYAKTALKIMDFSFFIKNHNISYILVVGDWKLVKLLLNRATNMKVVYYKNNTWLIEVEH
jgi:hypothetical protein